MSLALLEGYSSEEAAAAAADASQESDYESSSGDEDASGRLSQNRYKPLFDPIPSSSSLLPSADAAFSEVSGPPEFLNNCVQEEAKYVEVQRRRRGGRKDRKTQQGLPAGAVVEAKAQLVGIHERVRSDVEGSVNRATSSQPTASMGSSQGVKRVLGATNPNMEDAAELLRICLTCGVPKTYSNARGMICPLCGDRPPVDTENEQKKGSAVKDKEKLKRMKGQSSHATWKSETEMHLRQQFD